MLLSENILRSRVAFLEKRENRRNRRRASLHTGCVPNEKKSIALECFVSLRSVVTGAANNVRIVVRFCLSNELSSGARN